VTAAAGACPGKPPAIVNAPHVAFILSPCAAADGGASGTAAAAGAGAGAEPASAAAGAGGVGFEVPTSNVPLARGIKGLTDSYTATGQTNPPTIPVRMASTKVVATPQERFFSAAQPSGLKRAVLY